MNGSKKRSASHKRGEVDKKRHKKNYDSFMTAFSQPTETVVEKDVPISSASLLEIKLTDVLGIEHAVTNLRNSITKIINDAPDYAQLTDILEHTNNTDDSLKKEIFIALSRTNSIKLASKLKSLYEDGKLGLFDYILQTEDGENIELNENKNSLLNGCNLSILKRESKTTYREKPYPPPLPKIENPIILSKVFMHKSVVNDKRYLSNQQILDSHNERLEFLGDSILNNLITFIIFKAFPDYNEGELSRLRIELVNNQTLTTWSKLYDFDKELRKNISDSAFSSGKMKVYADVFEAYVGGLVNDGVGMQEISDWLQELADPVLSKFRLEKDLAEVKPLNKNAKLELYSLIGCAAMSPRYVTLQSGDGMVLPFVVACLMKDEELGRGEGQNIKEAGLRLAMVALENKPLMEKFSLLRRQMPRSVSVVRRQSEDNDSISTPTPPPPPQLSSFGSQSPLRIQNTESISSDLPMGAPSSSSLSSSMPASLPELPHQSSVPKNDSLPVHIAQIQEHLIDINSKGRLYGLLNKRKLQPEYDSEKLRDGKIKVLLSINNIPFVSCIHRSGKLAGQCAAQYLLENEYLLKEHGVIKELPL